MGALSDQLLGTILDVWQAVLGVDGLGPDDDFFRIGGDGVQADEIAERLKARLGAWVHPQALYDAPTPRRLAAYLREHYPAAVARLLGEGSSADIGFERALDPDDLERLRGMVPPLPVWTVAEDERRRTAAFVLSPPRSGSTLFRRMLGRHPGLFVPSELHLLSFDDLKQRREALEGRHAYMLDGFVEAVAQAKGVEIEEAGRVVEGYEAEARSARDAYRALQEAAPVRRFIERSTAYGVSLDVLRRAEAAFDRPMYVHLLRHPYGMIRSFEDVRMDRLLFRGAHGFSPRHCAELVWWLYHENIARFLEEVPEARKMALRYEDLLEDPQGELRKVCAFLEVPFDDALLDPYAAKEKVDGFAREDPKFSEFRKVERGIGERWRDGTPLTPLGAETIRIAEGFGYAMPALEGEDRERVLVRWNDTARPFPEHLDAAGLLEAQVERTPDAVAVAFEGERLTYRALDARANQMARRLSALGVGPEARVGILLERSLDIVVTLLAVWKAGGAYVPLDPALPSERLDFLLSDAEPAVLVTTTELLGGLGDPGGDGSVRTLLVDCERDSIEAEPAERPARDVRPDGLAYVIYTSGSTGEPKGVLVEHRGLVSLLDHHPETIHLGPGDRLLHVVSFSFDAASYHLFMTLCAGATVVLSSMERFGADPIRVLREGAITHAPLPSSVLERVPDEEVPSLRVVSVGADALSRQLADRWAKRCSLFNVYGPTEATVLCTCWPYETGAGAPPIGRPVANLGMYILDPRGRPVPLGMSGEIHVGGVGVARGYWKRPELTAERFIDNPFGEGRLYKTGDRGRFLDDGNIQFLGRMDRQVKVGGVRIELGEIESTLRRLDGVASAAVVVESGRLAAFVSVDAALDAEAIREALATRLPSALVPPDIEVRERLPLTPSGKIDRVALQAAASHAASQARAVEARDGLETALLELWREALGRDAMGIADDFFQLGGSSLVAIRLATLLETRLGIARPPEVIFQTRTVEGLARHLRDTGVEARRTVVPVHTDGSLPPLFWANGIRSMPDIEAVLGPDRPLYALPSLGSRYHVKDEGDLVEVARRQLGEIRQIQPEGPYHLGGFSSGGMHAFELAQQLRDAGEDVALLFLLDPSVPKRIATGKRISERAEIRWQKVRREGWRYPLRKTRWTMAHGRHEKAVAPPVEPGSAQRFTDRYEPRPYEGPVTLLCSTRYRKRHWHSLLNGPLTTIRIEGEHMSFDETGAARGAWIPLLLRALEDRRE